MPNDPNTVNVKNVINRLLGVTEGYKCLYYLLIKANRDVWPRITYMYCVRW